MWRHVSNVPVFPARWKRAATVLPAALSREDPHHSNERPLRRPVEPAVLEVRRFFLVSCLLLRVCADVELFQDRDLNMMLAAALCSGESIAKEITCRMRCLAFFRRSNGTAGNTISQLKSLP
jgi:hypothetical protein